tara:strand:+ start:3322 stop:7863 length:4542 start_codon:yes stop_codon:yes gene_type:complete
MTPAEQARRELERRAEARRQTPAPTAATPFPQFESARQRAARFELEAREAARERTASSFPDFGTDRETRAEEAQAEFRRNLADEKRKRQEALEFTRQIGGDAQLAAPPLVLPMFRPSRIQQVPVFEGPLSEPVRFERLYRDPDTGDLRPPTTTQEAVEALAQQPVLTENQARRRAQELATQREAIAAARAAGRPVPEFDDGEALVSGVLSRPADTGAVVETPLGAVLRGGLGVLEAAAGQVYFGALGYDVDPTTGEALDPDEFGAKVAEVREGLGLPETASTRDVFRAITTVPRAIARGAEAVTGAPVGAAIEEAIDAAPFPVVALPGAATVRTAPTPQEGPLRTAPSAMDPEERRLASDDPNTIRALARNVTVGRGLGDEFRSVPALRDEYARVFGDEDAAWWAGTLGSLPLPAGPGTAARASSRLGTFLGRYAPVLSPTQNLLRFADSVDSRVINAAADVAAAVSRTPQADARIIKRVAEQVVRGEGSRLGDEATEAALAAVRQTDGSSADATARAISRALGEDPDAPVGALPEVAPTFLRVQEAIVRNTPGDFVMVTDSVAAPRRFADDIRRAAQSEVSLAVERDAPAIARELRRLQSAVNEPGLAADLGRAADSLVEQVAADGLEAATATARGRATRSLVERAARDLGEDPRAAGQLFTRSTPDEVAAAWASRGSDTPVAKLRGVASWDDIDPQTLRLALEEVRSLAALRAAPGVATSARRLSDLQAFVARADNPKALDGRIGRRLRAVRGTATRRAPLSVERAAENIRATASQSFRTTGKVLDELAEQYGSVDKALDYMTYMATEGQRTEPTWKRILGYLYSEDPEVLWPRVSDILQGSEEAPTIQRLMDVDRRLVAEGVVSGWDRTSPWSFVAASRSRANMQRALLRNFMEETVRKGLAAQGREAEGIAQAILRGEDEAQALRAGAPPPGLPLVRQSEAFTEDVVRQYDVAATGLERKLAENGEEFAQALDSVPVEQRAGYSQLAADLFRSSVAAARNAVYGLRYGYAVPNLPLVLGRLVQAPVLSVATIGLENTARTLGQLGRRLDPRQWANRRYGGILKAPDGTVYTQADIQDLVNQYGLGATALETERVGSLANDLLVSARASAAEAGLGARFRRALDVANPATRSLGSRMAEAIELTYRRGVFEAALAAGEPPAEAALLARRSLLDYSQVPDAVQDVLGQYVATAAQHYQLLSEMVAKVADNPEAVRTILRAHVKRAQAEDPYGLAGDDELRSTIRFEHDGRVFYGPGNPLFTPLDVALTAAGATNYVAANLVEAVRRGWGEGSQYLGERVGRTGAQTAEDMTDKLFGILDILGGLDEAGNYDPGQVDLAELSDEQLFYATLLTADALDPDRAAGWYDGIHSLLDPQYVNPPEGLALRFFNDSGKLEEHPRLWAQQPPDGVPYIRVKGGESTDGADGFYVVRPSGRGLRNIQALRSITPEMAERGLRLGAALLPSQRVFADAILPTGAAGVAATVLPLEVGPSDPERQAIKAAESLAEGAEQQ